jgi:(2R)-3-sulfolactate dehydrogenase (NADP+)
MTRYPAARLRDLAEAALRANGVRPETAGIVADALVLAELDGIPSHGLARLPVYVAQVRAGKIAGDAVPRVTRPAPSAVAVDAGDGFAFPAIRAGLALAPEVARETGIAAVAIGRSHHAGVLGHPVAALADAGLVALAFANTPAAIAAWGGRRPLYGTNPIGFACPRRVGPPIVVDLSTSQIARGKILAAERAGQAIPAGWALDAAGRETVDATAALAGTMLPFGAAKGAALALMVELVTAALTGSCFGFEASSFLDDAGPPPRTAQLFLALAPERFGAGFLDRVEAIVAAILAEEGTRLPGDRRHAARTQAQASGIAVAPALIATLTALAGVAPPVALQ